MKNYKDKPKIIMVLDNVKYHHAKKISNWLSKNTKLELFFLPPYSPELNPQEYVNQDVKTNIIGKRRPINKAQMRTNVEDFMYKRKSDRKQVQKYFHVKHVRYAA